MQGQSSSPTTADDLSPSSSLSEMRLCESNSESSASPSQLSDTQSISEAIEDVSPSGADDGLRTLPSLKATVPSVDAYAFPPQTKGEGCVERSHSHSGVGDESVGGISDTGLYLATPTASGLDALASCPDQAKIPQTTDEPEFPITPDKTDMGTPPENMRASSTPLRDVTVGDYMITELPLIAPTSTATTDSIPASSAILSSTATSQERILPNQSLQQFSDETPGVCSTDTTNGASNGRSTASTLLVTDNGQEVSGGDARADTQLDLDSSEEISTPSASSDEEMSGYELKILGIPTNGIRTRVETQINLCLELVATDGRPLFEKLHIDQRLVSKTSQMVDHCILDSPDETRVWLSAEVKCDSYHDKKVAVCDACQKRERKRLQRAKSRQTMDDDGSAPYKRPLVFNTRATVDFSTGNVILPTRITCYCRHHDETAGFRIHISLKDECGNVVATALTHLIMVTDDHKSSKKNKSAAKPSQRTADQLVLRSGQELSKPSASTVIRPSAQRSHTAKETNVHGSSNLLETPPFKCMPMGHSQQGLLGGLRHTPTNTQTSTNAHTPTHTQLQAQARAHVQAQAHTLPHSDTATPCLNAHTQAHALGSNLSMAPMCDGSSGGGHVQDMSHTNLSRTNLSHAYVDSGQECSQLIADKITKSLDTVAARIDAYRPSSGLEGSLDAFKALCDSPAGALGMTLKQDYLRVDRIVPDNGTPGTTCAIVGTTLNRSVAYIGFGQYMVEAKMINPNTLLCVAPYHPPGSLVLVDLFDKHGGNKTGGMPLHFRYHDTSQRG